MLSGTRAAENILFERTFERDSDSDASSEEHFAESLRLTDFGLSRIIAPSSASRCERVVGTVGYIAPEILSIPRMYTAQADVWSCGVILFTLLTGTPPFHDANEKATLLRTRDAVIPRSALESVSPPARALVCAMLEKDPIQRPQAATLLLDFEWLHARDDPQTSPRVSLDTRQGMATLQQKRRSERLSAEAGRLLGLDIDESEPPVEPPRVPLDRAVVLERICDLFRAAAPPEGALGREAFERLLSGILFESSEPRDAILTTSLFRFFAGQSETVSPKAFIEGLRKIQRRDSEFLAVLFGVYRRALPELGDDARITARHVERAFVSSGRPVEQATLCFEHATMAAGEEEALDFDGFARAARTVPALIDVYIQLPRSRLINALSNPGTMSLRQS